MPLFDRFYILKFGVGLDIEQNRVYIPKKSIDDYMANHVRVFRMDGILNSLWRWVKG